MRKFLIIFVLVFSAFGAFPKKAFASLVVISPTGELSWNVLGETSENEIDVKKVASDSVNKKTTVKLAKEGENVFLNVNGKEKINVTSYGDDIVEIESQEAPRKITIKATPDGFSLSQMGVSAETSFPITVNSESNRISLGTSTGERYLRVLPFDAVDQVKKANHISVIPDEKIYLIEGKEGQVNYQISGTKILTVFRIFSFDVPVGVEVSATSGNIVKVDAPIWYSAVDFLL